METRELYRQKYEAQLNEWGGKLESLHAKAQKATAQAKLDLAPRLETARAKVEAAKAQLASVSHATDETWEHLKRDADRAWHEMKSSVEGALDVLKRGNGNPS